MLPPKIIMSPIDFSEPSQDALHSAVELARSFAAEILLAHVVPAIPKLPSPETLFHEAEYEKQLHEDAKVKLEKIASKISAAGVQAKPVLGTANDVSMELLRIAEQNDVDLIVIATHGMSGWRKLAFGSVTEKVVRLAECPVLVLRAQHQSESTDSSKTASVAV
jgi:nucleotide-binding universal stress UspA family protein